MLLMLDPHRILTGLIVVSLFLICWYNPKLYYRAADHSPAHVGHKWFKTANSDGTITSVSNRVGVAETIHYQYVTEIENRRETGKSLTKVFSRTHPYNCSAIINGSRSDIRRAERYFLQTRTPTPEWIRKNCDSLTLPPNVFSQITTAGEEQKFPIAFSILAYKDFHGFAKLFKMIYRPWNVYCVHIDAKSPPAFFNAISALFSRCYPQSYLEGRLILPSNRQNVTWGEVSVLDAALTCFRALMPNVTEESYNFPQNENNSTDTDLEHHEKLRRERKSIQIGSGNSFQRKPLTTEHLNFGNLAIFPNKQNASNSKTKNPQTNSTSAKEASLSKNYTSETTKTLNIPESPLYSWRYLLNIASSDFPLRTNGEIIGDLKDLGYISSDKSDIEAFVNDDAPWRHEYSFANGSSMGSILSVMNSTDREAYRKPTPPPYNLKIRKGSFSGVFSRNFTQFLLMSPIAQDMYEYLSDIFIPDEYYWSTMYHSYYKRRTEFEAAGQDLNTTEYKLETNVTSSEVIDNKIGDKLAKDFISTSHDTSKLATVEPFHSRYTHWGDQKPLCSGAYEHGLCIFGLSDLRWLLGGSDAPGKRYWFAHKFSPNVQPMTTQCLEEHLLTRMFHTRR